ncbi:MAG TPA: GNAT family N-acetyltransferase [Kofleriaceae bacterium]|nr:GNAT family N-acetyltransferase [Kofleriaceae bacterium]
MIRPAIASDYPAFATLYRELGLDEAPPPEERWRRELVHGTLIAERDGHIDGYVHFHTLGQVGYVRNLVVRDDARDTGFGTDLMLAAASALRRAGVGEWHLNVRDGNSPALHLYEKLGLRPEHRSTALRFPWSRASELPAVAAVALPVDPREDEDIERELHMLAGQIAMARLAPRVVLCQLRDATCAPVGFAAFDPMFPGARTFRVAIPAFAAPLLAALRPHARSEDRDLALVIDDHDALVELLVAHGATVKLRLVHYAGPLPAS